MDKIEAIEENKKRLGAVGNITKPRIAEILVIYGKTVRVQTAKEILWFNCIVVMNPSGVLKNGTVVRG